MRFDVIYRLNHLKSLKTPIVYFKLLHQIYIYLLLVASMYHTFFLNLSLHL